MLRFGRPMTDLRQKFRDLSSLSLPPSPFVNTPSSKQQMANMDHHFTQSTLTNPYLRAANDDGS